MDFIFSKTALFKRVIDVYLSHASWITTGPDLMITDLMKPLF